VRGAPADASPTTTELTQAVARLLGPATLTVAAAVLVKGYGDTGDGFSAGIIAATGVIIQYVAFGHAIAERLWLVRAAAGCATTGLLVAVAVAFAPLVAGQPPLTHRPPPGATVVKLGTLELHTALAFDLGILLLVLGVAVTIVRATVRAPGRQR
jgi:multisubunit Na+/H+ antiporter MnhB subunit